MVYNSNSRVPSILRKTPFYRPRGLTTQHFTFPLLSLLHPVAVLYLLFLLLDTAHRLLTKSTDLGGIVRYRSPGVVMLLLGAATYYAMREGETRAERFGEWLLEGTKVLVVSEAWAAVWRVVKRSVSRRVGGQKLVQETKKTVPARSGGKTLWEIEKAEGAAEKAERESGTVPARTVDEVGEQVRKLRLERIQALEAAAAVKRRARRGN